MSVRGYSVVALDNPKNSINVGSVLRAAGCFNAAMVVVGGKRNQYRKAPTDTMCAYRRLPMLLTEDVFDALPYDCVPVAVEITDGAVDLRSYEHPERAFYVFGAEDATLGERTLSNVRDVIQIPTRGCLNLAAAVNVVLYDRFAKRNPAARATQP